MSSTAFGQAADPLVQVGPQTCVLESALPAGYTGLVLRGTQAHCVQAYVVDTLPLMSAMPCLSGNPCLGLAYKLGDPEPVLLSSLPANTVLPYGSYVSPAGTALPNGVTIAGPPVYIYIQGRPVDVATLTPGSVLPVGTYVRRTCSCRPA